jgi:hypothetical protein
MAGQHDNAARLGSQRPNHPELFGEVRSGQLHISVDAEVPSDLHISPKEAGQAIPRVDGPQRGWPALSLSVDTY